MGGGGRGNGGDGGRVRRLLGGVFGGDLVHPLHERLALTLKFDLGGGGIDLALAPGGGKSGHGGEREDGGA